MGKNFQYGHKTGTVPAKPGRMVSLFNFFPFSFPTRPEIQVWVHSVAHPNLDFGVRWKVKWEKIENFSQNGIFRQKLMASFKRFCWGPLLRTYPILDLGPVKGPTGYRMLSNRISGRVGKLNGKKLKISPQNGVFCQKLMASLKPFCLGPQVWVDFGIVSEAMVNCTEFFVVGFV